MLKNNRSRWWVYLHYFQLIKNDKGPSFDDSSTTTLVAIKESNESLLNVLKNYAMDKEIAVNDIVPPNGNFDMNSHKIINCANANLL